MNEKEIDEIRRVLTNVHYQWANGQMKAGTNWIDAAAHAIAKKLAEGVAWQRGALVDNDANFILGKPHTVLRIEGVGAMAIQGEHFCEDGQRVDITVTKAEKQ